MISSSFLPEQRHFKRDLPNSEIKFLNVGHFVVESDTATIAKRDIGLFGSNQILNYKRVTTESSVYLLVIYRLE